MRYVIGLLLGLLAAVAIVAALANWRSASAAMPFVPSLEVSVGNANPGANSNFTNTHTMPAGHHVLKAVNVFIPNEWTIASDSDIADGDQVGEVRMAVDVGCDGTVDTLAAGALIDTAADRQVEAEWRATLGSWQLLFVVEDLPSNAGTEIGVTLVNASMPGNYCTPQTFSYTIFANSIPGGAAVATNATQPNTYTWDSAYLSFSFTGIQNEHTAVSSDSVVIGTDTPIPGPDTDGDSLGLGNPLWFRDEIELFVGTDPLEPCADDDTPDNEADDKLPADLNDDQAVNIADRARIVFQLLSGIYDQRLDLNADGVLNIQDRAIEVLYVLNFQPLAGTCTSL